MAQELPALIYHDSKRVNWWVFALISGTYRGAELALFPEKRRALRHFDQGIMRRLDGITRGSLCSRGKTIRRLTHTA